PFAGHLRAPHSFPTRRSSDLTFPGQGILVAGLRGGKDGQIVEAPVLDERLVEARLALDDVDEVEDDPALASHDDVEIAQTHVEIDRKSTRLNSSHVKISYAVF